MRGKHAELTKAMKARIAEGVDPKLYDDYADLMLSCMSAAGYTQNSQDDYRRAESKYIRPYLKAKVLDKINSRELAKILQAMYDEKFAYAHRTVPRTILKHIFSFAFEMERIKEDPTTSLIVKP